MTVIDDMIYDKNDSPFDRATVSLRPQVIKELLPEFTPDMADVKAF